MKTTFLIPFSLFAVIENDEVIEHDDEVHMLPRLSEKAAVIEKLEEEGPESKNDVEVDLWKKR